MINIIFLILIIICFIGLILDLRNHFKDKIKTNEIISQEEYKYPNFKLIEIVHKITYESNKIEYKQEQIYC